MAELKAQKAGLSGGPLERRLRDFLAQLEPELLDRKLRQAPLQKRVIAMLRQFHAGTKPGKAAALQELLVREPNADQDLRQQARHSTNERQRIAALEAPQRRRITGHERFVLRTTVLDRSKKVRQAAVAIGKPSIKASDITYMASGSSSSSSGFTSRPSRPSRASVSESSPFIDPGAPLTGPGNLGGPADPSSGSSGSSGSRRVQMLFWCLSTAVIHVP